jgi:hypothetical protein
MKDGTCGKCGDTKNIQEKHICCDGECLHDSCCAKVPENCPNKNKPIINSLGMKVLKYACCPHCEGKEMEEEDGSYTYACKNLECKCHKLDKIYDKAYEEGRLDVLNHLLQIADECEYEELRREVQGYADIHDIQIGEPVTYKN